jgi:hypothetical protein
VVRASTSAYSSRYASCVTTAKTEQLVEVDQTLIQFIVHACNAVHAMILSAVDLEPINNGNID